MALFDDEIKNVGQKKRKQRIGRTATWALLISLFISATQQDQF
jgi:hypothetical protein